MMNRPTKPILCALAMAAFAAVLSSQEPAKKPAAAPPPPCEWWRGNLKEARAEAVLRNVPILMFILQDDEESSDALGKSTFGTPEFAKLANRAVTILASRSDHGASGSDKSMCKLYRSITCAEHQHLEAEIYQTYFKGEPVRTPHVKVVFPDGKVADSFEDVTSLSVFSTALTKAVKELGAGIDGVEWKRVKDSLARAERAEKRDDLGRAFAIADGVASAYPKAGIAKKADVIRKRVQEIVTKEADAVRGAADAGEDPVLVWARAETMRLKAIEAAPLAKLFDETFGKLKTSAKKKEIFDLEKRNAALVAQWKAGRAAEDGDDLVAAAKAYRTIAMKGTGLPVKTVADERLRQLAGAGEK